MFQDWSANRGRPQFQLLLALLRLAQSATNTPILRQLTRSLYRGYSLVILNVDIPTSVRIGPRARIHHGTGLVIAAESRIGSDVGLHQGVTIGVRFAGDGAPTLGDGVSVGPNAVILGPIAIGDGARIGPLALVTNPVPAGASAVAARATLRARPDAGISNESQQ